MTEDRPTLAEIMEPWKFPLRKTVAAGEAVDETKASGKLAQIDEMLSALRGVVAMYGDTDRAALDDRDKAILRHAEALIEELLADRNAIERDRATLAHRDDAITKSRASGARGAAIERKERADLRAADALAGRLGPLTTADWYALRIEKSAAEIALGEMTR